MNTSAKIQLFLSKRSRLFRFHRQGYSILPSLKARYSTAANLTENKEGFFQNPPQLENQYTGDVTLQRYLKRILPSEVLNEIEPDLKRFGRRVTEDIYELGLECERTQPQLQQYDAWGKRIDKIITCESWKKLKDVSAEEGVIAIGYERKYGVWSRLYQMAKIYLFGNSSNIYSAPLAMTDGAAKTIEVLNITHLKSCFEHLISRDPKQFWTSGQWMTEKQGGSDVANGTETIAVPQTDGTFRLYGYKWFSSATDSDVAFMLARIVDENNQTVPGSKGITMFYSRVRNNNGQLNHIEVVKLKNKLGTRQLPTAELILNGTVGHKVSEVGKGVNAISNLVNVTRIHNALNSVAAMRRILSFARDYSKKRKAFGKLLCHHPLHMQTLARMDLEARGTTLFVLEMARLLGLDDCKEATQEDVQLLRLLTPLAKLYTAKQSVAVVSEGLEAFGGQGYIEDTGLPRILRDTQVTPIWEGTTNILSLDLLRVLGKYKKDIVAIYINDVRKRLEKADGILELQTSVEKIKLNLKNIVMFLEQHPDKLEFAARDLAFSMSRTFIGALLIEHAAWSGSTNEDKLCAQRWCSQELSSVISSLDMGLYNESAHAQNQNIVLEGYLTP